MQKYSFFIVAVFAINLISLGCSAKDSTGNNATATKSIATGYGEKTTTTPPTTTTTTTTEQKTTTAQASTGPSLFKSSNCTMCHKAPGVEGGGAMGPSLAGTGSRLDQAKMDAKFKSGGSHATRFKGSADELKTLIKWLLTLK